MNVKCPNCGHAIPVTINVSTKDRTEEEWLRLAALRLTRQRVATNAIAGPVTVPPRGVR